MCGTIVTSGTEVPGRPAWVDDRVPQAKYRVGLIDEALVMQGHND